jgi:hypothetical protein
MEHRETKYVINEFKGSTHWVEGWLRTLKLQTNSMSQQNDDIIVEQKLL